MQTRSDGQDLRIVTMDAIMSLDFPYFITLGSLQMFPLCCYKYRTAYHDIILRSAATSEARGTCTVYPSTRHTISSEIPKASQAMTWLDVK